MGRKFTEKTQYDIQFLYSTKHRAKIREVERVTKISEGVKECSKILRCSNIITAALQNSKETVKCIKHVVMHLYTYYITKTIVSIFVILK